MIALTTWIGGLLTAAGVIAYLVTGMESVTALIPSFVGILLLLAAFVGWKVEGARKHAMHAALLIALLGAAGSLMNVVQIGDLISGDAERPAAIVVSLILFVLCLLYLAAGINSFIAARKAKDQTPAA